MISARLHVWRSEIKSDWQARYGIPAEMRLRELKIDEFLSKHFDNDQSPDSLSDVDGFGNIEHHRLSIISDGSDKAIIIDFYMPLGVVVGPSKSRYEVQCVWGLADPPISWKKQAPQLSRWMLPFRNLMWRWRKMTQREIVNEAFRILVVAGGFSRHTQADEEGVRLNTTKKDHAPAV